MLYLIHYINRHQNARRTKCIQGLPRPTDAYGNHRLEYRHISFRVLF